MNPRENRNNSRPSSVSSAIFSTAINAKHTDIIVIKYSNRIFITVTQSKKIGNLYSICLDSPQKNGTLTSRGPPVYDIKCLLGSDTEESTLAVRALVEKLNLCQPLLLSLTIPDLDFPSISSVAEAILARKCW